VNADRALRLVDTHAHLDDPAFDADRDEVIAGAHDAGATVRDIHHRLAMTWD
jgi:Tat protein secretion system quality control protein TatD with DNase activity